MRVPELRRGGNWQTQDSITLPFGFPVRVHAENGAYLATIRHEVMSGHLRIEFDPGEWNAPQHVKDAHERYFDVVFYDPNNQCFSPHIVSGVRRPFVQPRMEDFFE